MQVPVDCEKERHLVLVDFMCSETGYLAPGPGRIIPVLQVLRGQDQGREEHPPTTLKSATGMAVICLFHREIAIREVIFDQN